jgi:hypothetical protein
MEQLYLTSFFFPRSPRPKRLAPKSAIEAGSGIGVVGVVAKVAENEVVMKPFVLKSANRPAIVSSGACANWAVTTPVNGVSVESPVKCALPPRLNEAETPKEVVESVIGDPA